MTMTMSSEAGRAFAVTLAFAVVAVSWAARRVFSVPRELRHLPCVPLLPLLLSYASGETEDRRILRLFLPYAAEHGAGLVLVWTFGTWMVHCLDYKLGKALMENRAFAKQPPPEHMLFWRFTGRANIFFIEGAPWKRQSRAVRAALARAAPVPQFVALAEKLFSKLREAEDTDGGADGGGGTARVCWSDLAHRFSLDAIGTTVLGHDFAALDAPGGPFVARYRAVMRAVADPLYLFLPALETWRPRTRVRAQLDALVEEFRALLRVKKKAPGEDLISYMLEDPEMSEREHRDNIIVLFMAGHDTTAGALSTLLYCLATHPAAQHTARAEVLAALGADAPTPGALARARLSYLHACVREALRLNNPSTTAIPRVASVPVRLGAHAVPGGTPVVLNMYGIMRSPALWAAPGAFDPGRFLGGAAAAGVEVGAEEGGWVPFGLGPRACPARAFSLVEQTTLLALLLRAYEWRLPADSPHAGAGGIRNAFSVFALNLPHDLDVVFTRRDAGVGGSDM